MSFLGGGDFLQAPELLCKAVPPSCFQGHLRFGELAGRFCIQAVNWAGEEGEGPLYTEAQDPEKRPPSPPPKNTTVCLSSACAFVGRNDLSIQIHAMEAFRIGYLPSHTCGAAFEESLETAYGLE